MDNSIKRRLRQDGSLVADPTSKTLAPSFKTSLSVNTPTDLIERLRKRAEIRRGIPRGEPDRIADLLEEAANALEGLND